MTQGQTESQSQDASATTQTERPRSADFPTVYRTTSRAARRYKRAQAHYLQADLLLLVGGATIGAISGAAPEGWKLPLRVLTAAVLLASVIVKLIAKAAARDQDWFTARAASESAKSAAWRYMMRQEPFDDESADHEFARQEAAIRAQAPMLLSAEDLEQEPRLITTKMRELRDASWKTRREAYVKWRLDDQIAWYHQQARASQRRATTWFWASLACHGAALGFAIVLIATSVHGLNLIGVFSSLAASATAWDQFGRNNELVKSYGLAFDELAAIRSLTELQSHESEFHDLVRDVESAIAREQVLWTVKRGRPLPADVLATIR
jgi:hypothetical protein